MGIGWIQVVCLSTAFQLQMAVLPPKSGTVVETTHTPGPKVQSSALFRYFARERRTRGVFWLVSAVDSIYLNNRKISANIHCNDEGRGGRVEESAAFGVRREFRPSTEPALDSDRSNEAGRSVCAR